MIYNSLLQKMNKHALYFCLIDPDKQSPSESAEIMLKCQSAGADAILIGGSLMMKNNFEKTLQKMKAKIPIIIFPGVFNFISEWADALLNISLLSSRNAQFLIGEHVRSAPLIKEYELEAIPTGYLLIESGIKTSVEFMSNSSPIPRNKNDIALAHALAGQYLGMKMIYLEAGSGAKQAVPDEMISHIRKNINIPLIVGGGIRCPQVALNKVEAGANIIVTGSIIEESNDFNLIQEIADTIHKGKYNG